MCWRSTRRPASGIGGVSADSGEAAAEAVQFVADSVSYLPECLRVLAGTGGLWRIQFLAQLRFGKWKLESTAEICS